MGIFKGWASVNCNDINLYWEELVEQEWWSYAKASVISTPAPYQKGLFITNKGADTKKWKHFTILQIAVIIKIGWELDIFCEIQRFDVQLLHFLSFYLFLSQFLPDLDEIFIRI